MLPGLYLKFRSPSRTAGMSLYTALIFMRAICPSAFNASGVPLTFRSDDTDPEILMLSVSAKGAASFIIDPVFVLGRETEIFNSGESVRPFTSPVIEADMSWTFRSAFFMLRLPDSGL